ncbi:hypothetical protein DBR09_12585 [Aeromonas sp. HMWF016]|nr:hypothetical protein DBR09_12585 [Aeromonas sp. HMWF016]
MNELAKSIEVALYNTSGVKVGMYTYKESWSGTGDGELVFYMPKFFGHITDEKELDSGNLIAKVKYIDEDGVEMTSNALPVDADKMLYNTIVSSQSIIKPPLKRYYYIDDNIEFDVDVVGLNRERILKNANYQLEVNAQNTQGGQINIGVFNNFNKTPLVTSAQNLTHYLGNQRLKSLTIKQSTTDYMPHSFFSVENDVNIISAGIHMPRKAGSYDSASCVGNYTPPTLELLSYIYGKVKDQSLLTKPWFVIDKSPDGKPYSVNMITGEKIIVEEKNLFTDTLGLCLRIY